MFCMLVRSEYAKLSWGLPRLIHSSYWGLMFDKKGGIEMKLVNAAITTLKDMVGPSAMNGCANCLDACQCTDPDSCKYD